MDKLNKNEQQRRKEYIFAVLLRETLISCVHTYINSQENILYIRPF